MDKLLQGGKWSFDLFNRSYARDINKNFQLIDAKFCNYNRFFPFVFLFDLFFIEISFTEINIGHKYS